MPNPEILPPEPDAGAVVPSHSSTATLRAAWQVATPAQKVFVGVLSAGFVCSILMFSISQFFQIRGVQHLLTSRIFLGIAWISSTILTWAIVRVLVPSKWKLKTIVLALVLLLAAIALDRAFPMPKSAIAIPPREQPSNSQAAVVISPSPQPQPKPAKESTPSPVPMPLHVYDLTGRRGEIFLALLNTQLETRDTIRVGCIAWSEDSCIDAGKFLLVFSEAGWKIDSNKVFRLDPSVPPDGMTIASRQPRYTDNLPPHMGHWGAMDASQITYWTTFNWMQIPVGASGDPEMPEGTIGIYFGPEPRNVSIRSNAEAKKQLASIFGVILIGLRAPQGECGKHTELCDTQIKQWTKVVATFLDYCDCGIDKSWPQIWKVASDYTGGEAMTIARQDKALQKFIISLNRAKS
jgi:hypothetical protein